jgi:hypothetical protein
MREIIDWICKEFDYSLWYYLTIDSYDKVEIKRYDLLSDLKKEFGEKKCDELKSTIEKLITWLNENIVYYASWDCDSDGNIEYNSIIWNSYSQFVEDIENCKELL